MALLGGGVSFAGTARRLGGAASFADAVTTAGEPAPRITAAEGEGLATPVCGGIGRKNADGGLMGAGRV